MKCAFVSPGFLPVPAVKGGGVEQLMNLIIDDNEIYKKIDFDLYTLYCSDYKKYNYKKTNLITIKYPSFLKKLDLFLYKICKIIKIKKFPSLYNVIVLRKMLRSNTKYDYIIIENNMYLYKKIYKKLSKKYDSKYIFHLHNNIGNYDKPIELCKFINQTAYKILTVSNFLTDRFKKLTNSNKVCTLYNCVSIKKFSEFKITKEQIRKKYNLRNELVFLYCGRFHPEKGLLELLQAFDSINNNNIKLLVVGDKPKVSKYSSIKKYFNKISEIKNKNIIYTGYIDRNNISSYFNACDVVIVPTICEEAFGLVAVEAMAAKKTLIVTNSGGLTEIVDNNWGIIIEKENLVENLILAIKKVYFERKNIKINGELAYKKLCSIEEFEEKNYYKLFVSKIFSLEGKQ